MHFEQFIITRNKNTILHLFYPKQQILFQKIKNRAIIK